MCDENTVKDNQEYLQKTGRLSRRLFTQAAAAAAAAILLPRSANAQAVTETNVLVTTPDGSADCYFVHPSTGKHPGVIVWPDIIGLRPAFRTMGKRLAESGYSVLVVNPYYRNARAPVVAAGANFQDPAVRETIMPLVQLLTASTNVTDAKAFVRFLDEQPAVDTKRKMGTTGYCMGGPMTLRTAAAVADRIGAGASFHGASLVTEAPDSPHLLIPQMRAEYLIAIAENDDERQPEVKNVLRAAYDSAGLSAEIEVYTGTLHGWCALDSSVYNQAQAERAWARLLALFDGALA